MQSFGGSVISFLAILNPFALCLYLEGVVDELHPRQFVRVLVLASVMSFAAFVVFALAGEPLLVNLLSVRTESLRIFSGVIFFVVGYKYATKGFHATELLRGTLDELPSAIALPFMIGAGTITQSILIGKHHSGGISILIIATVMAVSFTVVITFNAVRARVRTRNQPVFDRYVNILSRLNGLLIGAISSQMIVSGIRDLWTVK
ncbi:MAG: MarC family protein [Planctomycetota bacterium]